MFIVVMVCNIWWSIFGCGKVSSRVIGNLVGGGWLKCIFRVVLLVLSFSRWFLFI